MIRCDPIAVAVKSFFAPADDQVSKKEDTNAKDDKAPKVDHAMDAFDPLVSLTGVSQRVA